MNAPADPAPLRAALLSWFDKHGRALPWRAQVRDPYRVWISEIMLQQTQVSRGAPYFERFVAQFPDVASLAVAPQEAVLKAWEGCGYYARARNLHRAAQQMLTGGMPSSYEGWLALPGVGPYTAAAVSSLAYGEARAVNDGNVRRVLARLYAETQPTEDWVQRRAQFLLDPREPGRWNEALMDLGATVCTPKAPQCQRCPLTPYCAAYIGGQPAAYPAPKARPPVKAVSGVTLIAGDAQHAYLEERRGSLLGGLYGLPMEEGEGALEKLLERLQIARAEEIGSVQHAMTHRRITLRVYRAPLPAHLRAQEVSARSLSRLDHKALALLGGLWSAASP